MHLGVEVKNLIKDSAVDSAIIALTVVLFMSMEGNRKYGGLDFNGCIS